MRSWMVGCLILMLYIAIPAQAQQNWEAGLGVGMSIQNCRSIEAFAAGEKHGVVASIKTNTLTDFSGDMRKRRYTGVYAGYLNKFHPKAGLYFKVGAGKRLYYNETLVDGSFGGIYRLGYLTVNTELTMHKDFSMSFLFTLFPTNKKLKIKSNYYYSRKTIDVDRQYY